MPINIGAKQQAGFNNPLELLTDCHRRIEYFLGLLITVVKQTNGGSVDLQQREALDTALRYFRHAAPKHTLDEEESLFPRLRLLQNKRARSVFSLLQNLSAGHDIAEELHERVELLVSRWLSDGWISPNDAQRLSKLLANLTDFYEAHIAAEEQNVFPLAADLLTASELESIGSEMADRRGITLSALAREGLLV